MSRSDSFIHSRYRKNYESILGDFINAFDIIAEQKITEAMKVGVFDSNPFNGIPIEIDDDYSLSAESRFRLHYFKVTRVSSEVVNHLWSVPDTWFTFGTNHIPYS